MEHKDGSGSSEDHDKMVSNASSSSFSPSSSLHNGENDVTFPEFEENEESISRRSNPESSSSSSSTPKTSSSSRLTLNLSRNTSPRYSDFDSSNASPIQSPPIQVMAQSDEYDPSRIPSSIFASKPSDDSEWSLASNESLFSIHMGNISFSSDSDFFISQSGKIHWIDDGFEYSCFTPDGSLAPTVEDERKSSGRNSEHGEKEELETLNASTIDSVREKKSSPDSRVTDLNRARNSDTSSQSSGSFAFPVLAGGSPVKEDAEKPQSPMAESKPQPAAPATTPKAGGNQWFNCFSCFPICC